MPARRVPAWARWAFVAALPLLAGLVYFGVWPEWVACPGLVLFFAGLVWIATRDARVEGEQVAALRPTPEEAAARTARREADRTAFAAERAEHERVEAVLVALLAREGVRYQTVGPLGGHMDKRDTSYALASPLCVTPDDLAALSGPLSHVETTETTDGRLALVRLQAHDRHGGGVEVRGPAA